MANNKIQLSDGTVLLDLTDTTATASDVASGKYFHGADGVLTLGTASGGGGGASNYVTGTFTGTTTGTALNISVPYTGAGYPIAILVHPADGAAFGGSGGGPTNTAFYQLIQQYAIDTFTAIKCKPFTAATYTGSSWSVGKNEMASMYTYKSSSSSNTDYDVVRKTNSKLLFNSNANAFAPCMMKSATTLSVYIASDSYGFAANIEYRYHIMYSE